MKNYLIPLFILGTALYAYRGKLTSTFVPPEIPDRVVKEGNCSGKKLCAIVYLAPWCPACHQLAPIIKSALPGFQNNAEHGISIIMGMENAPGDNERSAKEISDDVVIDSDKQLAKSLNVSYFPTVIVVDQRKKVKYRDQEAYQWIAQHTL